jgi:hypothetical protein
MADFADNDIQELLQQAEQRLSGGRIVAKEASTASAAKPAGEEDVVKAVAAPTPELAQVRVPQPKLGAQRKGKVSRRNKNSFLLMSQEIAGIKMKVSRKAQ